MKQLLFFKGDSIMFKQVLICIVFLLSSGVVSAVDSDKSAPKEEQKLYIKCIREEGLRRKTNNVFLPCNPERVKANSQELFLGGIKLYIMASWQLHIDASGNAIIDVKTIGYPPSGTWSHNAITIKKLNYINKTHEYFHRGVFDGLRFTIIIKPKDIKVVIDKSCMAEVIKRWPTGPVLGEKPLSFREGFPVLQNCLSAVCRELFTYSRPGIKHPLPDTLIWKETVQANCAGKRVGILHIAGKQKKPSTPTKYLLKGMYCDNKGPKIDVGDIGALEMNYFDEQGIRLPAHYSFDIKSYAVDAPQKKQIRVHKKTLVIKIVGPGVKQSSSNGVEPKEENGEKNKNGQQDVAPKEKTKRPNASTSQNAPAPDKSNFSVE